MTYRVAVIGTGPGPSFDSIDGRTNSFAYTHAEAYRMHDACELKAGVDIVPEYVDTFADEFGLPSEAAFTSHTQMLDVVEPDIVSIVTPIPTHAPLTIDCARAGVAAVHCEKPMARTWAEARAMAHICDRHDVQLTISHQKRFGEPIRRIRALIDADEIGEVKRIETSYGNFFDHGTHIVDLIGHLCGEPRAVWVMGQIDYSFEHLRFGVPHADHTLMSWQYENGVVGVSATGNHQDIRYDRLAYPHNFDFFDCDLRVIGTDGSIEHNHNEQPTLQVRHHDTGWEDIPVDPSVSTMMDLAIDDVVRGLMPGHTSELRAENALKTAEILFAGHESARRRGRIELPLTGVYDHPLESMLEAGDIKFRWPDERPPHPADGS